MPPFRSAWQLWRDLASKDAAMATNEADRARMIARHSLVVRIIEINSQQMRCQSARNGLEIERACAARDAALPDAAPELADLIAMLEQRMAALDAEDGRLAVQRDFLSAGLLQFDETPTSGEQ
jgi:hypothetical protein